jgi:drug/metabolite transporter (DMT)-like permease
MSNWRSKGLQAAVASSIFLGLAPVFGKQAILFGFSPLAVVSLRTTLAALLLFIIMAIFKRGFFFIYPVGLWGCFLAGFINGLGSILYYTALSRLDASIGQLIYSFYPLFVAFWLILDRHPIHRMTLIRLSFSIPGIILLLSTSSRSIDWVGALLMLGSAILYAFHLIINQRVLFEVPAPTVTFYTLLSMSVTVIVAYIIFDRSLPTPTMPWWPIIGMAVITFLSRVTLFFGVKFLGGLQTAILGLGELLITVILAHLWLGDYFTVWQWVGAALLAVSLFLVAFDKVGPEKKRKNGLLAWLNPPFIQPGDIRW